MSYLNARVASQLERLADDVGRGMITARDVQNRLHELANELSGVSQLTKGDLVIDVSGDAEFPEITRGLVEQVLVPSSVALVLWPGDKHRVHLGDHLEKVEAEDHDPRPVKRCGMESTHP